MVRPLTKKKYLQDLYNDPLDCLYTTAQLAERLNKSRVFVEQMRWQKRGPAYFQPSPRIILYKNANVRAWIEKHFIKTTENA